MNEFRSSQNNCAKKSIMPSQGTHNWLFLSKHVKTIIVSGSHRSHFRKLLISLEKKAKVRGFNIGPKWKAFPSKARILVIFKNDFS